MVSGVEASSPGSPRTDEERESSCRSGDGLILSQESSRRHEQECKSFPWADGASGSNLVDSRNLPSSGLPEPLRNHASVREEEGHDSFKPPVSVIVIQKPVAAAAAASASQDSFAARTRTGGPSHSLLSRSGGGDAGDGSSPLVSSFPTSFLNSSSSTASSTRASNPGRPRASSLSSTTGASLSSPFRLQPRNPPKLCTPRSLRHSYSSPPRSSHPNGGNANATSVMSMMMSGGDRGKKRRAHSMSTYPDPALAVTRTHGTPTKGNSLGAGRGGGPLFTCAKPSHHGYAYGAGSTANDSIATETTVRESMPGTPFQDSAPSSSASTPLRVLPSSATPSPTKCAVRLHPGGTVIGAGGSSPEGASAVTMMNFQGLSLLSPSRSGGHFINPGHGIGIGSPEGNGDFTLSVDGGGSAAASPASSLPGSQASHARSCFSKYKHHESAATAAATAAVYPSSSRPTSASANLLSPFSTATAHSVSGGSPKIAPLIVLGPKSWLASASASTSTAGAPPVPSNVAAQLESAAALMDAKASESDRTRKASRNSHGRSPQHRVGASSSSPEAMGNHKKRPPLHQNHAVSPFASAVAAPAAPPSVNNWMQSLDESAKPSTGFSPEDPSTPPRFLPPSTVLCHPSTPGSTLSVEGGHPPPRSVGGGGQPFSVLTFKSASRGGANYGNNDDDDEELMAHPEEGRASQSSRKASPPSGEGSRARRHVEESPGKRSVMSMSPTSTPLPKLTLTPRSTTSNAARQLFLSLPTPSDLGGNESAENDAGAARSSTARAPASAALPSPKRNSYIPLPEWASSGHSDTSKEACVGTASFFFETQNQSSCKSNQPPTSPPALLSKSLLSPPSPNDAIERFLKNSSYSMGMNQADGAVGIMDEVVGHNGNDDDSLSASDDDEEAFFLATPLAIQEEKQSTLQQSKHRKLRDQSHASLRSHQSFASSNIMQASSTSLRGMNFVTSSTSLDKIGSKLSSGALCLGPVSSLKRQDSQTSIGLTLEATNAPSCDEGAPKGAITCGRSSSSFSNSAMGGSRSSSARDLVTPPVMAQPKSPPPLPSPRIDTTTSAATLPRSLPNHRSQRCDDMMDLGGSNWSSPSPPPSSSAHRPWPCSGEAESPVDRYTTRVVYTSTAPDRPPTN